MKTAFICDLHLPNNLRSAQYAYFTEAVKKLKEDGVKTVICLGDVTSFGEKEMFEQYLSDLKDFDHRYVIGNSDVRDSQTKDYFLQSSGGFFFECEGRHILGIDTPFGRIEMSDRERLEALSDGDLLVTHYYVEALDKESRAFLTDICERKELTVIVGHQHKKRDYSLGRSRIIGLRALDPDKSIGGYPCAYYFDLGKNAVSYEEVSINTPLSVLKDLKMHFGISCVDNFRDLNFALENGVSAVELRTNGADWTPDLSIIPLIEKWRAQTGGYLSVHFPNLKYKNGEILGKEQWLAATDYAIALKADGATMHPPKVCLGDMTEGSDAWTAIAELYLYTIERLSPTVKVGIENMHMEPKESDNSERGFGYTPAEVSAWIDALNSAIGRERVGHVLDVGHARNNGSLSKNYPISRWYEAMGKRTVAYHIHQVLDGEKALINHNAIENWLGPIINYASFFYSWEQNTINHVPVFLEVKGSANYQKSVEAFDKLLSDV